MTPSEITRIGQALFGKNWKSPLARRLGTRHNIVWKWATGRSRISPGYETALRALSADPPSDPFGPEALTALGEALYGRRWRGALARDLGTTWSRVDAWRTGQNRVSLRYREKLRGLASHRLTWVAEQEFPGFYGVAP